MKKLITICLILLTTSVCWGKAATQFQIQFVDEFMRPVNMGTSVSCYIYQAGTTTEISCYLDQNKLTAVTQPITDDSTNTAFVDYTKGMMQWYMDYATFDLYVTDGTSARTFSSLTSQDVARMWPSFLVELASAAFGQTDDLDFTYGAFVIDGDTAGVLDITPDSDDGTVNIGSTTYTSNLFMYGGTSGRDLYWDASENTLEFLDNTVLAIGTGDDYTIAHNGSTTTVTGAWTQSGNVTVSQSDVLFDDTYDIHWDTSEDTLGFLDNAVLAFGNTAAAPDVELTWDADSLNLTAGGADYAWEIGGTAAGFDITYAFETAGQFRTDYDGDFINLTDDMDLRFGTGASSDGDFQISSNSSNVLSIAQVVADTGTMTIGADGTDIPLTWYAETTSDYVLFTGDDLRLEDVSLCLGDGTQIQFGDALGTGDFALSATSNVLAFEQVVSGTGTITKGADGKGIDETWYAETTSDYMKWDQDGTSNVGTLVFEDSTIMMMDDTRIIFGDGSDASIQYDEDGQDGLQITGVLYGARAKVESVAADDTLTTAADPSGKIFYVTNDTDGITITLPSMGATEDGWIYTIYDANEVAASDVTIEPADTDTIGGTQDGWTSDGADEEASITITYIHDSTDWAVISVDSPTAGTWNPDS